MIPNVQTMFFPDGKTKFVLPDGSIGEEPANGSALLGVGDVANEALRQCGLGACFILDRNARLTPPPPDRPGRPKRRRWIAQNGLLASSTAEPLLNLALGGKT